jgi:nucleoside-diphosphate kinase
MSEKTLILVKPDGVQRGLVGEILSRFERKGLKCVALKMIRVTRDLARRHYAVHEGKPFYDELIEFITSGPLVASVWEGADAVALVRKVVGATSPDKAEPGTVRGDFAIDTGFNLIHASDAPDTARHEIDLFFEKGEILTYDLTLSRWLGK